MNNNFGKIRSFGFFSMIFLSLVGFGMFTYSQTMGKILGSNGIFLTIVYGLIYMILVGMIYKTFKINEFKPLEFIFEDIFGKFIGRILLFLISLFIIFFISIQLRIFIDSIKIYIFSNISSEFMVIITLFVCYYVVRKDDKVLSGLNEIIFTFLMIFCLISLFIVFKNIDLTNILPIRLSESSSYLNGFFVSNTYFIGGSILYYIFPKYDSKIKKNIHISYKAVLFSFLFLATIFFVCISVIDLKQTIKSAWPIILAFTSVDIPGGFIERIDGIIISIAILFFIINFINLYFYSSYLNSKSLGLNKYKFSSLIFIPVIYIFTLLPQNLKDIEFMFNKIIFPISIVISLFVPIILFVLSYVKSKLKIKKEV